MKNKKLALSVLSTAVVASMASSAFAAEQGFYIGGDVKHYYSLDSFFSSKNTSNIEDEVNSVGFDQVVYVDEDGKAANLDDLIVKGENALSEDLDAVFGDTLHDDYTSVDQDGHEGEVVQPEPADGPVASDLTAAVNGNKVTISGSAKNAKTVEVTIVDKDNKDVATKTVDVASDKFTAEFADLAAGDYTYEVIASNDDEDGDVQKGSKFTVAAPAELKVDSVNAINLKQVKVNFNNAVNTDKVTVSAVAAGTDNIRVYDATNALVNIKAVWSADKKSVVLTDAGVLQSAQLKIVVEGVKDAKGVEAPKFEQTVTAEDKTNPTVSSVNAIAQNTIEVISSEPVSSANFSSSIYRTLDELTIDGVKASAKVVADDANNKLTFTLSSNLTAGTHTIVVSNLVDAAGFKSGSQTFTVNYAGDSTPPAVTSVTAKTKDKVTVVFNEPVTNIGTLAIGNRTWNAGSAVADEAAARLAAAGNTTAYVKIDDKTYDLYLAANNYLSAVDVLGSKLNVKGATDLNGNAVDVTTGVDFAFTAENDTTKPTATVSVGDGTVVGFAKNSVRVVFSEPMDTNSLNATDFVLKDSTGKLVGSNGNPTGFALVANTNNTTFDLTFPAAVNAGGTFTLTAKPTVAKPMYDMSVRQNSFDEANYTISIGDNVPPQLSGNITLIDSTANAQKVMINFSEAMDASTLTNLNNYIWTAGGTSKSVADVTGATATVGADNKSVTLKIPGATAAGDTISVLNVKDLTGNRLAGSDYNRAVAISGLGTFTGSAIKDVYATNARTLVVELNSGNKFSQVDPNGFVFEDAAAAHADVNGLQVANAVVAADGASATLTLTADLNADGTFGAGHTALAFYIAPTNTNTKDAYGRTLTISDNTATANLQVEDLINPALVSTGALAKKAGLGNDNTVVVTFNEALAEINSGTDELLASAFEVKLADGTVLTPVVDYTASVNGSTVELLVKKNGVVANQLSVALKDNRFLGDLNDNNATIFAAKTLDSANAITEHVAPTVNATLAVVDGTHVKVTFSEAVDVTTAETFTNYALSGTGGLTGTASAASLDATGKVVTLTVADTSAFTSGQTLVVTVTGVTDIAANVVDAAAKVATYVKP